MGSRQGVRDKLGCGLIINHIIAALAAKRPRAFLLENVKGLVLQHRATLHNIMQQLGGIAGSAYKVGYKVVNAADHGIPQHRERVYTVGLLRASMVPTSPFKWPTPQRCRSLPHVLQWKSTPNVHKSLVRARRFLANATPKLKHMFRAAWRSVHQKGVDPRDVSRPVVVDVDGPKPHWMHGVCPCLTRSRAATGHYLPVLGRRLSIQERFRFQGLPAEIHEHCRGKVSERHLGSMIGNSLSLNVVQALLSKMLPACGLMEATFRDSDGDSGEGGVPKAYAVNGPCKLIGHARRKLCIDLPTRSLPTPNL